MNNEQNLEQRIFAQAKNIRDDKAYFGAHLNLARHNAFIILHHINQRLGFIDQNVQDDAQFKKFKCLTILKQSSKPDLIAKSLDLIRFHFPFLQILTDKLSDIRSSNGERKILTPQEEGEIIESLLTDLNGYRNEYCHGENKSHVPDSYLIKNLKSIYDASLRMVKERFKLEPHKIKHLERNNKDGEKLNFKYALSNNSSISEKGLVFFINLFLEVKDSYSFIKKIEGFKNAGTNSLNATTYCFTIQHVRLPNPKITSQEYTKEELLLRMMNYLEKVPDQIFKTLSPADQENCKSNVDVFETPIEGDLIEKSLHKRYRDQFPEFALNYIDYYKLFPNIRFQINLGKFIFSVKDKEILGETRKRRQIQMLRGFGQIQDYQNKKNIPEIWQSLINKSHEIPEDFPDPYINDMEPHYHIENNNIYFKFMEPDTTHWPRIDARIENQNNINAHPRPRLLQADGILSVYELAPLLFYEMIRSDKSKSAETILSIQKSNIERLLNDIKSGELTKVALDKIPNPYSPSTKKFNTAKQVILKEKIEKRKIELNEKLKKYKLALDDLPKMILYYLLNIEHEDISLKVIPIIKSMQVETNHLLNKLQHNLEKRNKPGEKGSKLILSGELASFLAQDMLALQAKSDNSRDKANSQEYQHLQYKLAYYSLYIDEFKSIFKKLNLIDSDKFSHPFLSKLTKIFPNIIQFYEWYLNERKKWLMDIETKPEEALKFIKLKKSVNITGEQLVDQFLVKTNGNQAGIPYNFPRGIFDDAIKSELEKNDKMKAIISNTKRVNSHFLINRYIEHEKNNKSQSFYEWKRNYEIYDRLEDDRKKMFDPLPKKYKTNDELGHGLKKHREYIKTLAERDVIKRGNSNLSKEKLTTLFKNYEENEKEIRLQKTQDQVLYLMIVKSISDNFSPGEFNNIALQDFVPNAINSPLAKRIPFEIKYGEKKIFQEEIQIKKIGEFHRFLKDRRLINLMAYIKKERISRSELEYELGEYQKQRILFLEKVLEFEQKLYAYDKFYFDNIIAENNRVEHWQYLRYFEEKFVLTPEQKEQSSNLRNKFSHNEYPEIMYFEDVCSGEEKIGVASQLAQIGIKLYEDMVSQIQK